MSEAAKKVFEEYISLFNRAVGGEQVDPFSVFDKNCKFTCTGNSRISAKYQSLQEVVDGVFSKVVDLMGFRSGYGFYPAEYFGDGDRMVALMRGRGASKLNRQYNNSYFFLFEVKDGKIIEAIEDMDASLTNCVLFDLNIVPKASCN
ncbi:MAG: hypothetical protein COA93_03225 [Alphaproteobacteria bacterium]|nr:MAG: hypothetical protein COA93_03225 [Alphaproteobacteria bacterium]